MVARVVVRSAPASVADLCAGSGIQGLVAVASGAQRVRWVEREERAARFCAHERCSARFARSESGALGSDGVLNDGRDCRVERAHAHAGGFNAELNEVSPDTSSVQRALVADAALDDDDDDEGGRYDLIVSNPPFVAAPCVRAAFVAKPRGGGARAPER